MASREFTDSDGIVWRVWDVSPAYLHPITRSEDFMAEWAGGWLAFESSADKRRLPAPYPADWTEFDLPKIEALCRSAIPVAARPAPAARALGHVEEAAQDAERAKTEVTFLSPRGRQWTLRLHEYLDEDGTSEMVLRFSGEQVVLDVRNWPRDWKNLSRTEYALLLLDADLPRYSREASPRRRRGDDES